MRSSSPPAFQNRNGDDDAGDERRSRSPRDTTTTTKNQQQPSKDDEDGEDDDSTAERFLPELRVLTNGEDVELLEPAPSRRQRQRNTTAAALGLPASQKQIIVSGDSSSLTTSQTPAITSSISGSSNSNYNNPSSSKNRNWFPWVPRKKDPGAASARKSQSCGSVWTRTVLRGQEPVKRFLTDRMAVPAARYPKTCLFAIALISFSLIGVGWMTNFRIESSETALWTPEGSQPEQDRDWIQSVWKVLQQQQQRPQAPTQSPTPTTTNSTAANQSNTTTTSSNSNSSSLMDPKTPSSSSSQRTTSTEQLDYFVVVLVHAHGANVISRNGALRNFEALDRVRSAAGYREHCQQHGESPCAHEQQFVCFLFGVRDDAARVCPTAGVSAFWLHNATIFQSSVTTDRQLQEILSINVFPGDDEVFDVTNFLGDPVYEESNTGEPLLVSAQSYLTVLTLPGSWDTALEERMVEEILQLQQEWDSAVNASSSSSLVYSVEVIASRSFNAELNRGVYADFPLIPVVAVLMSAFTAAVFWKRGDCLHSQTMLGIGAVITVLMSLMSGYGLMFCIGVPFTNLTLAMLYVVFGIALDDTFVLYAAFLRTDPTHDTVDRVRATFEETAISILMTTVTTEVAFALGCTSKIPAIRWLSIYATTTVGIDFIYQITFFIALLVLDEARIKAKRKDWLICCKVEDDDENENDSDNVHNADGHGDTDAPVPDNNTRVGVVPVTAKPGLVGEMSSKSNRSIVADGGLENLHSSGRIMGRFADFLLIPWVKALIIVLFVELFAICIWSTTRLSVGFDFRSVLPSDSYVIDFYDAATAYTNRQGPTPFIYFRNVDQSDPEIQSQMISYVNNIVAIDAISDPPFRFWLREYQEYAQAHNFTRTAPEDVLFIDRLYQFLDESDYDYWNDLVFDETGRHLLVSRTRVNMDNVDSTVLKTGLGALYQQRKVSTAQPINQRDGSWAFFTYDDIYLLWEFLYITPVQLRNSTLMGLITVGFTSLLFMPHWTGILFVLPMVAVIYVDLLGFIQWFGINVNGVTYVSLVMAIGLLVDYMMHVTLRYYETPVSSSRDAKVKDVLRTMGGSVLLGGLSTFVGIVPLMFSASDIVYAFVVTFSGVVVLGLAHALLLLPVLLSLLGPQEQLLDTHAVIQQTPPDRSPQRTFLEI